MWRKQGQSFNNRFKYLVIFAFKINDGDRGKISDSTMKTPLRMMCGNLISVHRQKQGDKTYLKSIGYNDYLYIIYNNHDNNVSIYLSSKCYIKLHKMK